MKIGVTSVSMAKSAALRAKAATILAGHEVRFLASPRPAEADELVAFLADCDAALVGREVVTGAILAKLPRLKAISVYGVGFDNVDAEACRARGVALLVAHGVNADAVAEHTLGLILACMRNIARNHLLLAAGTWNKDGGHTLAGKVLAVVGCGAVGSRVGRLANAFGCSVRVVDLLDKKQIANEIGAVQVSLAEALRSADILSMHVPLTAATDAMVDERFLAQMKPGAHLINTSRGRVVRLSALKKALESGHLAGAGLDVFETEPILDLELFALTGLVGTPHTAGNAVEAVMAMGVAALDQLRGYFDRGH